MIYRLLLAVCLVASWSVNARAAHTVSVCGDTCNSGEQCNLGVNLSCSVSPAITLNTGADFDFQGHTITCSGCAANTSVAVVVNNSNSTIEDTVGNGGVFGAWGTGIECNLNASSIVKNVRVDGYVQVGIDGCRKVDKVVVSRTPTNSGVGISNQSIGSSDYIRDSYIIGGDRGIWLDGSGSGSIDHNNFARIGGLGILAFYTSTSLSITGNSFYVDISGYPIGIGINEPITSGNICGDPAGTACADCISSGLCQGATTPFVGP